METRQMKCIRLGAVYGASPIFCADIDKMGYVEPRSLPIAPSLVAAIKDWDQEFQQTFCEDYPPDSRFESEEARVQHNVRGVQLWKRLQKELGAGTSVEFIPQS
ncbi:hypothetical protein [Cupriavidus basilensis]|uniref:hypothetical protein n=1 Tax=Cupriavidus basilensis TaxID=68895 RepID=UPI0039F6E61D